MSASAEHSSAAAVDPTAHRPSQLSGSDGLCEFRGPLEGAEAGRCPGWLEHRTSQSFRVERWENNEWAMLSGAKPLNETEQLRARFPQIPMRVVAETTTYMVVATAPATAEPAEGDRL